MRQAHREMLLPAPSIWLTSIAQECARGMQVLKVPAGEWVLQNAAGSALGRQFIAIARRKGVRTINLVCDFGPI